MLKHLKYIGVVNLVVWLHMLSTVKTVTLGSSHSALPDDGEYTGTCWSCFNVNFNSPFKEIILYISW